MTTLYVCKDIRDRVLYVGISKAALQRWSQHRATKAWWDDVATVEMSHYGSRLAALEAERVLIQTLRPPYNLELNPRAGVSIERTEPVVEYVRDPDGLYCTDPWFGTFVARCYGMCGGGR